MNENFHQRDMSFDIFRALERTFGKFTGKSAGISWSNAGSQNYNFEHEKNFVR